MKKIASILMALLCATLFASIAHAGGPIPAPATPLTPATINAGGGALPLRTALQTLAARADAGNLLTLPVNSVATITSPSSAISKTGMTNLTPSPGGYTSNFTGTPTNGSNVITGWTYSAGGGLATYLPGSPLAESVTTNAYPANIPLGTYVTSVNTGAGTVTMSKPATGSASITGKIFTPLCRVVGGVIGNYGGNSAVVTATTGNSVTPPTAQGTAGQPVIFECMTDSANFSTSTPTLSFGIYFNGVSPFQYRVAIDNVYQTSSPQAFGASSEIDIQFNNAGTHKVRVEVSGGVVGYNIYTITGSRLYQESIQPFVRAGLFGDSFFQGGAGGQFGAHNTAAQYAILMGFPDYDDLSVSGTGYVTDGGSNYNWASTFRTRDVSLRPYDILIDFGSVNDCGKTAGTVTANALTAWQAQRAALPNAPIIIFGVPTTLTCVASTATIAENAMASAFASWGDTNAWFVPITTATQGAWWNTSNSTFAGGGYVNKASFTASISGTSMVVSAMTSGTIIPYMTVSCAGCTGSPAVLPGGPSNGQTGTYTLSTSQGTIASEAMTGGDGTHPADNYNNANGPENLAKLMAAATKAIYPQIVH